MNSNSFSRNVYFQLLLVFFSVNIGSAQTDLPCGTEDMPWSEYQDLKNGVGPTPSGGNTMSFNLPIWLNLVTPDPEGFGWGAEFAPKDLIEKLNSYFSFSNTNIQFYLCGITYIRSNEWTILDLNTEQGALRAHAKSINSNYENVINVFLVNQLLLNGGSYHGYAGAPLGGGVGAVYLASPLGQIFAHEVGHFLSLPHTFSYGPLVSNSQNPQNAQYVNDEVTLSVNGGFVA